MATDLRRDAPTRRSPIAGWALLVALVVAVPGLALGAAAPDPAGARSFSEGVCPDETGVTVVVDFRSLGGSTIVRCAHGPQQTGQHALEAAGVQITGTNRWGKAFVCRLDGKPGVEDEPCVDTPPASAYWSYWHAEEGGQWTYSDFGVQNRTPPEGSFEGWSFYSGDSDGNLPTGYQPPRFDPVRPAPEPPPASEEPSGGGSSGGGSSGGGSSGGGSSGEDGEASGGGSSGSGSSGRDDTSESSREDAPRDDDEPEASTSSSDAPAAEPSDDDETTDDVEAAEPETDEDTSEDSEEDEVRDLPPRPQPRATTAPQPVTEPTDTLASEEVELVAGGRSASGTLAGVGLVTGVGTLAGVAAVRRRRAQEGG